MEKDWLQNKDSFPEFDVRTIKGNFLPAIIKKAKAVEKNGGITIIQNFEPIPLYGSMKNLGFEYFTEKKEEGLYHSYFFRKEILDKADEELPLKPIVMPRYAEIDPALAGLTVNFWANIWNQGIGHFSSEIAQSSLFKAYRLIKEMEKSGKTHSEIMAVMTEKFSEKNPETGFNN